MPTNHLARFHLPDARDVPFIRAWPACSGSGQRQSIRRRSDGWRALRTLRPMTPEAHVTADLATSQPEAPRTAETAVSRGQGAIVRAYPPSWVDVLDEWARRLPAG